jgi:hypothetical protein
MPPSPGEFPPTLTPHVPPPPQEMHRQCLVEHGVDLVDHIVARAGMNHSTLCHAFTAGLSYYCAWADSCAPIQEATKRSGWCSRATVWARRLQPWWPTRRWCATRSSGCASTWYFWALHASPAAPSPPGSTPNCATASYSAPSSPPNHHRHHIAIFTWAAHLALAALQYHTRWRSGAQVSARSSLRTPPDASSNSR